MNCMPAARYNRILLKNLLLPTKRNPTGSKKKKSRGQKTFWLPLPLETAMQRNASRQARRTKIGSAISGWDQQRPICSSVDDFRSILPIVSLYVQAQVSLAARAASPGRAAQILIPDYKGSALSDALEKCRHSPS